MNVRYFDEFKWADESDGTAWFFRDESGEHVAEVVLNDPDSKMWRFLVNVPPRYRFNGSQPAGLVHSAAAAKKVCELILSYTILTR
jgi:hypothetical protein